MSRTVPTRFPAGQDDPRIAQPARQNHQSSRLYPLDHLRSRPTIFPVNRAAQLESRGTAGGLKFRPPATVAPRLRPASNNLPGPFFPREVAQSLVNLSSWSQDEQATREDGIEQFVELIKHLCVSAQPDWVQQMQIWCGYWLEDTLFVSLMELIEIQLAQAAELNVNKR